jgi:hypothetical protein
MSSTKEDSHIARVQNSFQLLSTSAVELNAVSDRLGKIASRIDLAFQKLNLGIEAWVAFHQGGSDDRLEFWFDQVGYAKVSGKWGLAIRSAAGREDMDSYSKYEEWLFNDAPRALRIDAVDKIPELCETLTKEVAAATIVLDKKATLLEAWLTTFSTDSVPTLKELAAAQAGKK